MQLSGTILLVDDDDTVRNVTSTLLELLGARVIAARSGREAITLCSERSAEIRMVIMDMTMPELDGVDTLRLFRERGLRMPVLLVSGYAEDEARGRLPEDSIHAFLQKPFGLAELSAQLQDLLNRAAETSKV